MDPVWSVERDEDFDAKDFARRILDDAVENLKKDRYLQAAAFVVTPKHLHCLEVSFQGQEEKEAIYQRVTSFAREHGAEAIITLNDAYCGEADDAIDYYPGKLKELGRGEMIWVAVTGPKLTNWDVSVEYRRQGDKLIFQLPKEGNGGSINMVGDWAANIKSVN